MLWPALQTYTARPRLLSLAAALAAVLLVAPAAGATSAGDLEPGFDPAVKYGVEAVVLQPDGKILIGGGFTEVAGVTRNRIARLNADGSLDTSFNPNANGSVRTIVLQPNGKILIGGTFSQVAGQSRSAVARINADGSLDDSFGNAAVLGRVNTIALDSVGNIVIGGQFDSVGSGDNLRPHLNLSVLSSDGTVNTSFTNPNVNAEVYSLALQDGKILIGGIFNQAGVGEQRIDSAYLARIQPTGEPDPTFTTPGLNDYIGTLLLQSDGKLLIAGHFTAVGGQTRKYIARLNADGSRDDSFGNSGANTDIYAMAPQPDGKILIGGNFQLFGGVTRMYIARLLANGSLDDSFTPIEPGSAISGLALQPDGRLVIGGSFATLGGQIHYGMARLFADVPSATPTAVAAVAGTEQATVSWLAPLGSFSGYTAVAIPGGQSCTSQATSCTVTGLTAGSAYTFTVTANNVFGPGPASLPSAPVIPTSGSSPPPIGPVPPGAPGTPTATAGNGQATVSWTPPTSDGGSAISGYTAIAAPGGQSCQTSALSCTVTGLANGTSYTFTVVAANSVGIGPASPASAAVTPQAPPPTPSVAVTGLKAKVSKKSVSLSSRVTTNVAGKLSQVATTTTKKKTKTWCRTTQTATAAGNLSLTCNLGKAGRQALRNKALKLTVVTVLQPASAAAATQSQKLTLKRRP